MGGEPQHVQDPPRASHRDDARSVGSPSDGRRSQRQLEVVVPEIGGPAEGRTPDATTAPGDRPLFYGYFLVLLAALSVVVVTDLRESPWQTVGVGVIAAWCAFCAAANMLPVPATRHISLSMGAPVNVAIAFLFPPGLAAVIVGLSSLSEWEIKRETTVAHALFNRTQLAASTALASAVLSRSAGPEIPPLWLVCAGVVAYQVANWGFVAIAEWTARRVPIRRVIRGLVPAGPVAAATYLLLGFMGLVLGLTSQRIGVWAVALVMLPLLGARHAVNVSGQLERAERERRSLADRLIDERERERVRIASDIHDVVLQHLAALQLDADTIATALEHRQPAVAVRLSDQLRTGLDGVVGELRSTIASLRRAAIDEGGLGESLQRFARAFRVSSGLEVHVTASGGLEHIPLPVALLVFECCQEALTNAARHAEASTVHVSVELRGDMVQLTVDDDGVGYSSPADGAVSGRSGLKLSRDKVELSGGLLFVTGHPGQGTNVVVRVPLGSP